MNLIGSSPYPYKAFVMVVGVLMLAVIALPVYGIYRLIIRKMTEKIKAAFHKVLAITGIVLLVIFLVEGVLTLITEHQVNKQLGFSYATPETQEGEPFLITRVEPGKTMDKAGLKKDDIVTMFNTTHLYSLLVNNQGKEVSFLVLRDKKEITIRVRVPELELPLRLVSFLI